MREYYVYMVCCSDSSYYIGVTNDYESRLNDHQNGVDPKAYTFKRRPVKLVYLSEFPDISDAISWEKQIKRWSRKKKEALMNENWEKLEWYAKRKNVRIKGAQ